MPADLGVHVLACTSVNVRVISLYGWSLLWHAWALACMGLGMSALEDWSCISRARSSTVSA